MDQVRVIVRNKMLYGRFSRNCFDTGKYRNSHCKQGDEQSEQAPTDTNGKAKSGFTENQPTKKIGQRNCGKPSKECRPYHLPNGSTEQTEEIGSE